ncbi:hypothetical protein [Micromonospora sediminicola]|uniref:hypothetical protein n=1 Tax=Micromonospora sediminicola TaxID=946078 RepID=UPI00379F5C62
MGLDAYVYCRCWQDGLAAPCPVGPVGYDDDGYLDLLLPWEGNESAHDVFQGWLARACPHELMEQADERVSNWPGVRLFQQAVRSAGTTRFPLLAAALPNNNGGRLPADQVGALLLELDAFRQTRLADEVELVDEATGRGVMTYVEAYRGVLVLGPGLRAGVDPDGFFVLDTSADPPVTRFRATRFTQRPLPGGEVEFVVGTTRTRVAMSPVGEHGQPPPELLAVRTRPRCADDYAYIVEPLRRLCAASLATGNPVMWC